MTPAYTPAYTPAAIRTAILAAADHIERAPDTYEFMRNGKPSCGTPGCMLGWIGAFLGINDGVCYASEVARVLGHFGIYRACSAIDDFGLKHYSHHYSHNEAKQCAVAMRLYADANFPAPVQPTPDWNAMAYAPQDNVTPSPALV